MTITARHRDREVGGAGARASWLAWVVCAMALTVLALVLVLIFLGLSTPLPRGQTPWRDQAVSLVGIVGAPVLGGLIASRHPENPYGWLWLGFGLGLAFQLLGESYAAYALVADPGSLPAPRAISRLLALGGALALAFAPFLLLLFPTGHLPSRRWRPIAWIAGASGAGLFALILLFDSPEQVGGAITAVTWVVVSALIAAIGLSALSLVVRYRRASGVERQQLKWLALAAVLTAFSFVGQPLGEALWNLLDAAATTALYVAVGVAIFRHRLYDIDVIINRALVYGSLTATLVALYFGGIVVLQRFFVILTGERSTLAVVASTLLIAALFSPLRRWVQAIVDRRFYRKKYDAAKTLAAFNARLREETDLDGLCGDLVGVATSTVQAEHVSLWLRPEATQKGVRAD